MGGPLSEMKVNMLNVYHLDFSRTDNYQVHDINSYINKLLYCFFLWSWVTLTSLCFVESPRIYLFPNAFKRMKQALFYCLRINKTYLISHFDLPTLSFSSGFPFYIFLIVPTTETPFSMHQFCDTCKVPIKANNTSRNFIVSKN